VKSGKSVVEVLARSTSKAVAVLALQREQGAAAVAFVGDDRTDEEVFAALGPADLGVRVGPGDTAASHRLADPQAVLAFLRSLTARL
jgi:trehalose 6-phosphate phosphatase